MAIRRNPVGHSSARSAGCAPNTPRLSSTSARSPITWSLTGASNTRRPAGASDGVAEPGLAPRWSVGPRPQPLADPAEEHGGQVVVGRTFDLHPHEVVEGRDQDEALAGVDLVGVDEVVVAVRAAGRGDGADGARGRLERARLAGLERVFDDERRCEF